MKKKFKQILFGNLFYLTDTYNILQVSFCFLFIWVFFLYCFTKPLKCLILIRYLINKTLHLIKWHCFWASIKHLRVTCFSEKCLILLLFIILIFFLFWIICNLNSPWFNTWYNKLFWSFSLELFSSFWVNSFEFIISWFLTWSLFIK